MFAPPWYMLAYFDAWRGRGLGCWGGGGALADFQEKIAAALCSEEPMGGGDPLGFGRQIPPAPRRNEPYPLGIAKNAPH